MFISRRVESLLRADSNSRIALFSSFTENLLILRVTMSSYKRARYSSSMEELIKQGKLPMGHLLAFDEDGDVCIQIENYKILVSSEKLSSVSPVFAAMLNGGFREGMTTPMGDQHVHQVSLPDDDIDLVILFCKIPYDRQDTIETPPGGLCWLGLAEFCDKYQCVQALKTKLEE